ncbi:MAG: GGDEF domain-containing protein [Desulfobacterales bacterium]|nr:GGDEF domain-containing protein [Desulfobacterales bacterium]
MTSPAGSKHIAQKEHAQALRLRRAFLAFCGYILVSAGALLSYYLGFIRDIGIFGITAILLALLLGNLIVFALIHTGINRRFADPSMTLPQLVIGIVFCTVLAYYTKSPLRGMDILLYILVLMFGVFRLRLINFIILSIITTFLYAGTVALLHHFHPAHVDIRLETLRTASLLLATTWTSFIFNYIASMRRKIRRIASHDELTGLYNRREIFRILAREKALSQRSGLPFSLCILDLDDFKAVNDTYSHLAGDFVLKEFARILRENIRAEDYAGRYGGEEFIVIFVNYNLKDNHTPSAQRLLAAIRNLRFPDISDSLRIAASIGVAAYRPEESIDSLLARADQALYLAKLAGKNRIVCGEK